MNVLVVGYGSIGRRHVLNLTKLDCIDKIIIYTKIKNNPDKSCAKKIVFSNASSLSLSDVCGQQQIDFAIIANETYKHIDTAILLAENGCNLFVEKPLSHNLEKIDILEKTARNKEVKIFVAYNLRFLPAIQYVKDQISRKTLGDLFFAKIEAGQYLPSWRKNINYQASYSASAEYGGGVDLDLSHEIDYMRYFFGEPCQWKTLKSKASHLKINSNDIFEGIYKYQQGFICNVHLDYLQATAKRAIRIVGSLGTIDCDIVNKQLKVCSKGEDFFLTGENLFRIEDTYMTELQHFIKAIKEGEEPVITVNDGAWALRLLGDSYYVE